MAVRAFGGARSAPSRTGRRDTGERPAGIRAGKINTERWSGDTRNWKPVEKIHLSPEKKQSEIKTNKAA